MAGIHYDFTGDAGQLIGELTKLKTSLDKLEGETRELEAKLNKVGKTSKDTGGGLTALDKAAKGIGGRFGEASEKAANFGEAIKAMGKSGPLVAAVVALEAALIGAQLAMASLVLKTAEWHDEMGDLLPLTDAQADAANEAADAYAVLGTQAKRIASLVGGQFADEVKEGINALSAILSAMEKATAVGVKLGQVVYDLSSFFLQMNTAGFIAARVLGIIRDAGEEANDALQMPEAAAFLAKLEEAEKKAADAARERGQAETETVDGVLDALEREDEARAEAAAKRQAEADEEQKRTSEKRAQRLKEIEEDREIRNYEKKERQELVEAEKEAANEAREAAEEAAKAQAEEHEQRMRNLWDASMMALDTTKLLTAYITDTSEKEKAAKTAFAINKAATLVGITIDTAGAIMRAFRELGPVAGGIAAASLAATGGVQAASVAAQQLEFPFGGIVPDMLTGTGASPDHVAGAAQPGEAVLNRATTAALGADGVDALNRGAMPVGGGGPLLMIYKHRVLNRVMADNLAMSSPLSAAIARASNTGHRRRR